MGPVSICTWSIQALVVSSIVRLRLVYVSRLLHACGGALRHRLRNWDDGGKGRVLQWQFYGRGDHSGVAFLADSRGGVKVTRALTVGNGDRMYQVSEAVLPERGRAVGEVDPVE